MSTGSPWHGCWSAHCKGGSAMRKVMESLMLFLARIRKVIRTREHLTLDEVEQLPAAARRHGRHGHRDSTLLILASHHGLRVGELVALRWEQVDLALACCILLASSAASPPPIRFEGPRSKPSGGSNGSNWRPAPTCSRPSAEAPWPPRPFASW